MAAWADHGLPADEAAAVELHLSEGARCQEVLAAFARSAPAAAVVTPFWMRRPVQWSAGLAAAAAIALIDACVRVLPGVMGKAESLEEESFERGLLEYPHYTRPQEWQGRAVPEVLVSGHHARVREWRLAEAERITKARRPDLWARYKGEGGGPP